MIHYLTAEDVENIHTHLVEMFSDEDPIEPPGVKSPDLLISATLRPQTSLGDIEKYSSIEEKAAALFHSLIKNHAFHNGNKRTALVSIIVFLDRNGRLLLSVDDQTVFDFVVSVAADRFPKEDHQLTTDDLVLEISKWLKRHTEAKQVGTPEMRINEFIEKVSAAGCRVKKAHGNWTIVSPNPGPTGRPESITIQRSTSKLNGSVVKRYLNALRINESQSGISKDEFFHGVSPEQDALRRFRNVLKSLANA